MVGLDAANRHQRVCIRGNRIRNNVFQLSNLVAAKCQTGVAVVAFGINFHTTSDMRREPFQWLDRCGTEHQRIALKSLQHTLHPWQEFILLRPESFQSGVSDLGSVKKEGLQGRHLGELRYCLVSHFRVQQAKLSQRPADCKWANGLIGDNPFEVAKV